MNLARTTLLRPGDQQIGDRKDAGWNHSAGDLAALLASRVLQVPVTVVHADLNHLTFTPASTDTAGPGVVLHLADNDLYRPAVPSTTDALLLNTESEIRPEGRRTTWVAAPANSPPYPGRSTSSGWGAS